MIALIKRVIAKFNKRNRTNNAKHVENTQGNSSNPIINHRNFPNYLDIYGRYL